jgi:hypothetical protein
MSTLPHNKHLNAPKRKRRSPKHHSILTVQHNYHDHALDLCCNARHVPPRGGVVTPFPLNLHAMLERVEQEGLGHIVSWQAHGRCFVVHDPKQFANILTRCFKISKVSSFQRQLNLYGFQRLTKGPDGGGYYHELFLRGKEFLSQNIQRITVKGTKIRARSNPEQEPNFYEMPWVSDINSTTNTTLMPVALAAPQAHNLNYSDNLFDITDELKDALPNVKPLEQIPSSIWDEEEAILILNEVELHFADYYFPAPIAFENIENASTN